MGQRGPVRKRVAAAACAAIASAGCGTGAEAGDTEEVRATVTTLLSTCAAGRAPEVLHLLTVPAQRAFVAAGGVREGCEAVIDLIPDGEDATPAGVFEAAEVAAVHVTGGIADVEIRGPGGRRTSVEAEDLGDDWRVTSADLP
jgi:hypothetical protein